MMKRSSISPIFSLADTFTHTVQQIETFEDFGSAHDGHHIGLFFRKLVDQPMMIDYENPEPLNRFCKMYNFVNKRRSVYGHLFVISDVSKVELAPHKMVISCNKKERYDSSQHPITTYRQKLLIFKSSTGSVLALSGNAVSPYLVTEAV
jgi:hypothetical protein